LATKSKNTMSKWQFKFIAHIIILLAGTGFLWSGYQIGTAWEYLTQESYYDTWEFESNYTRLVHNILEKELELIDEAHIEKTVEDEKEKIEKLSRLRQINRNLDKAKSFRFLLINTQTMETKSNFSNAKESMFNNYETAIQWNPEQIAFPGKSLLEATSFGRDIEWGYSYTSEGIFSMLKTGPYRLLTGFDENIQDPFFTIPYKNYQQAKEMEKIYYSILIASLVLGVGAVVYLGMHTGKGPNRNNIKLCWLDRVFYEFQILFLLLTSLVPMGITSSIYNPEENTVLLVLLCISMNIWVLLAIHILLSVIRNIRNHRFVYNILCIRIGMGIVNLFKNMIKSYKPWLIIAFFGVCLINMIFVLIVPSGPFSIFAVFVLFNLLVLKVLVKYLRGLQSLMDAARARARGSLEYPLNIEELPEAFRDFGADLNAMQSGLKSALDEAMRGERMKTELITNVTHDLKNPLTSIINYVDLLKKEEMASEEAKKYIAVLEDKSIRLKDLISHVVEASKASSGNIEITKETIDVRQLMQQILAEYEDEFHASNLEVITQIDKEPITIETDSKIMYRIIENLVTNIYKYSMNGSRVYINLGHDQERVIIEMKNISKEPLNIDSASLMERFVRGDTSRNTEGSGLGLSIAGSLAKALGLKLEIEIDGDLFKTSLTT